MCKWKRVFEDKKKVRLPRAAPNVVKREKPLEKIRSSFSIKSPVVAIVGDSAAGKSELSKQYSREYQKNYHHIWFVQTESWEQAYRTLAADWKLFSLDESETADTANIELVVSRIHEVFSKLRTKKSLIIFDNAPKGFSGDALKGNLPQNTDILVTSKSTDWPNTKQVNLVSDEECHMTFNERMEILTKWVPPNSDLFDSKEAKEIVNRFKLSPVVIAQAGRFIERTKTPMSQYLGIFNKSLGSLEEILNQGAIDNPQGSGTIDIFVSLKIPLEKMMEKSQKEQDFAETLILLQHVIQLPNKNIPKTLLQKALEIEPLELNPLLEMLDFLIIKDTNSISIHDLFQEIVLGVFLQNSHSVEDYSQRQTLILSKLAQVTEEYTEFLIGDPKKATAIYTQGIEDEKSKHLFNAEKVIKFTLLNGHAFVRLGDYSNAERCYRAACETCENHDKLGSLYDHSRMELGSVLGELARFSEALPIFEAVATNMENISKDRTEEYAKIQTKRGWMLERRGLYRKAITIHEQTLSLRKDLFNNNPLNLEIADSQHWLGWALERVGRYEEAKDQLYEAYTKKKGCLGENHLMALHAEHDYAMLLGRIGDYDTAISLFRHVKAQRKKIFGKNHSKYADCIHNFAVVLAKKGELEEAKKLFAKSIEIKKKAFPKGHPSTVASMHGLANVLVNDSDSLDAGVNMHRKALTERIRLQGPEHPYAAYSKYDLACALSKTNDPQNLEEAERLHRESLEKREDTFQDYPDHPLIADSKIGLGIVLEKKGEDIGVIKALYSEGYRIRAEVLGKSHPDTLEAASLLGRL